MHTREQARGSLGLQSKRPRRRYQESISIDSRDVSPVEARRPCKPLPESSSSESPPKRSSVQLVSARATRERREIRNRRSSPQLRRQLRDFEEPAEPSQWRPQAAFGAESITQALPQSWSQRPHRIGNLIFGTSYVSDLAAIVRFKEWLTKSPIHCHVVLCQTHNSAVAEWLQNCGRAESASFHVLLESKRVIYITARVFMVLLRRHVEITVVRQALTVEEIDFAVVEIKIYQRSTASVQGGSTAVAGRRTAVAVGIVHVMPQLLMKLPEWLMKEMKIQWSCILCGASQVHSETLHSKCLPSLTSFQWQPRLQWRRCGGGREVPSMCSLRTLCSWALLPRCRHLSKAI